jgi:hypothetical protein
MTNDSNTDKTTGKKKFGPPVIRPCQCSKNHEHQDAQFGKNMRFCNWGAKGYSCTVCGKDL